MSIKRATSTCFIEKLFQIHQQSITLKKKFQYTELQVIKHSHLLIYWNIFLLIIGIIKCKDCKIL
jgi:hypothetical protein